MAFKKGQSGNPGGRPKNSKSLNDALRKILQKRGQMEKVAKALFDLAVDCKHFPALQEIFNRIDGKVVEKHEIEGKSSITLLFTPASPAAMLAAVEKPKALEESGIIEGEVVEADDDMVVTEPVEVKAKERDNKGSIIQAGLYP